MKLLVCLAEINFAESLSSCKPGKQVFDLGDGVTFQLRCLVVVTLKFPQICTAVLSFFNNGTIGATHSENGMGSIMPSWVRHSSCLSVSLLMTCGMERAL